MASKFPIWGEGSVGNTPTVEQARAQPVFGHIDQSTGSDALGQGAQQLGQGVQQLGAFLDRERDEADKQVSLEKTNEYRMATAAIMANFSTLQGKQAMEAQPKVATQLQELRQRYLESVPNKRAGDYFTMRSADPMVAADREAKLHAAQQYTAYQEANFASAQEILTQEFLRQSIQPDASTPARQELITAAVDQLAHSALERGNYKGLPPAAQLVLMQNYVVNAVDKAMLLAVKEQRVDTVRNLKTLVDSLPREQFGDVAEQFRIKHADTIGLAFTMEAQQRADLEAQQRLAQTQRVFAPAGTPDPNVAIDRFMRERRESIQRGEVRDTFKDDLVLKALRGQADVANATWVQYQHRAAESVSREYGKQYQLYGLQGTDAWNRIPDATKQHLLMVAPDVFVAWERGASNDDSVNRQPTDFQLRTLQIVSDQLSEAGRLASMPQQEFDALMMELHPKHREQFIHERFRIQQAVSADKMGKRPESLFTQVKAGAIEYDEKVYGNTKYEDLEPDKKLALDYVHKEVRRKVDEFLNTKKFYPGDETIQGFVRGAWAKAKVKQQGTVLGFIPWTWETETPRGTAIATGQPIITYDIPSYYAEAWKMWADKDPKTKATLQSIPEADREGWMRQQIQATWDEYADKGVPPPWSPVWTSGPNGAPAMEYGGLRSNGTPRASALEELHQRQGEGGWRPLPPPPTAGARGGGHKVVPAIKGQAATQPPPTPGSWPTGFGPSHTPIGG